MLDIVLRRLCQLTVYYVFHKTRLWYYYPYVYKNTTRGTNFTSYSDLYDHIAFLNLYGLMVYFTTFIQSLIYYHIVMIGGGLCGENIPIY